MTTFYRLCGKDHKATVTACEPITNDRDYGLPYYLWTLTFDTPVRLYDGTLMYKTCVRRFSEV